MAALSRKNKQAAEREKESETASPPEPGGTLGNILSTGVRGSTPDTAPGTTASLRSQITASEPVQGGGQP